MAFTLIGTLTARREYSASEVHVGSSVDIVQLGCVNDINIGVFTRAYFSTWQDWTAIHGQGIYSGSLDKTNRIISTINVTHLTGHLGHVYRRGLFNSWGSQIGESYPNTDAPRYDVYTFEYFQNLTEPYSYLDPVSGSDVPRAYCKVIDPITEPPYPYGANPIVSVENNGKWSPGGTYNVTVYESYYIGYFANQRCDRRVALLGRGSYVTSVSSFFDKKGLINSYGLANLFSVELGENFYSNEPELVNNSVTNGVIDSVTLVDSVQIENEGGYPASLETTWYYRRTYRNTYAFKVSDNAPSVDGNIVVTQLKDDREQEFSPSTGPGADIDTYVSEKVGSSYLVRIRPQWIEPPVPDRPETYDPDADWDKDDGWVTDPNIAAAGGGRFKQNLIIVGHKKVFIGE